MSAGPIEYTGDTGEVTQTEPDALPLRPVAVTVAGQVEVHHVPSRSASAANRTMVAADGAVRVANADPRRRHLTLLAVGAAIQVGYGTAGASACTQGVGAVWPELVPLSVTHQEEVWVLAAGAITLAILEELWAD